MLTDPKRVFVLYVEMNEKNDVVELVVWSYEKYSKLRYINIIINFKWVSIDYKGSFLNFGL